MIKDLCFGYDSHNVIDHLNLKINPKDKLLIQAPSGSGKSTLFKLLMANLENYHGSITYNKLELSCIDLKSLYQNVSIIDQDVCLFNSTIRNNITLFKEYSDEEINKAIDKAGLSEFVNSRTNKLDDVLHADGKNISKGEKTRIAIARAILKNTKLIFADEIGAALDPDIALKIENELLNLDCAVIMISHKVYADFSKFTKVFNMKEIIYGHNS